MTPTNRQIYMAAITILDNSALTYPVAYPGFNFTPPSEGVWLEVLFRPNEGIADGIADTDSVVPQGIFQVNCVARPGAGIAAIQAAADKVAALYAKGTTLSGKVRISRQPYSTELAPMNDRMMVFVTVQYSG